MYWAWVFLFAANPAFLLLGMCDVLGGEAKRAADDVANMYGAILIVAIIVAIVVGAGFLIFR